MSALIPFTKIRRLAEERKGGKAGLEALLRKPLSSRKLASIADDRYLAAMTRAVFNSGFTWKVIEHKWPGFEEAFHGFNPRGLAHMAPEKWEACMDDTRIVRHWPKIQATRDNAHFVYEESERRGGFGRLIADWPVEDLVGLLEYLKVHGSRLGGKTGMYFLRRVGKDGFVLSHDVVARLQASGIETKDYPTSKRELKRIQDAFNQWHAETGLCYTHLSQIAGYSIGRNPPSD